MKEGPYSLGSWINDNHLVVYIVTRVTGRVALPVTSGFVLAVHVSECWEGDADGCCWVGVNGCGYGSVASWLDNRGCTAINTHTHSSISLHMAH